MQDRRGEYQHRDAGLTNPTVQRSLYRLMLDICDAHHGVDWAGRVVVVDCGSTDGTLALAQGNAAVLADARRRAAMGSAGRSHVLQLYGWNRSDAAMAPCKRAILDALWPGAAAAGRVP